MDKALLDTDMLSEILKGRNPTVVQRAAAYKKIFNQLTTSVITVMEIVAGFHKVSRKDALKKFLTSLNAGEVLAFDQPCAEIAGRIYADLKRTGQPIGRADTMIAAIALNHSLTLATGNTHHYKRVQTLGYPLQIDNWREPVDKVTQ